MTENLFDGITIDQKGKARLPGKRVTIDRILSLLMDKGMPIEDIMARHPSLTHRDILITILYACKEGGLYYAQVFIRSLLWNNSLLDEDDERFRLPLDDLADQIIKRHTVR